LRFVLRRVFDGMPPTMVIAVRRSSSECLKRIKFVGVFIIWTLSLVSILLMLIRPRGIAEAYWVGGGALLLVLSGLLPVSQAGQAIARGFDVYLFLIGMMILSELAREKGVFDWIAEMAANHANGSSPRLFLLIYLAGTGVTALLSNDATAVVLTPAVLTTVRRLKVDPKPYLLACAFIANAASFILPISNPANLVVFDSHLPPLFHWLRVFILPSLLSVLVTFVCLRFLSRRGLCEEIKEVLPRGTLPADGKLALGGLLFAAVCLIVASVCGWPLGAPTCGAALVVTMGISLRDSSVPVAIARGVAWSVIPLVAGLFMIMEALENAGMLRLVERGLATAGQMGHVMGNLCAAFPVGLVTNVMNNLPVGLISGAAVHVTKTPGGLGNAVLIGVDLGPNLSVTGSLATILWLIALRREKVKISFWQFLKVGAITMPAALIGAVLVLGRG
jgi:arsenical pump membrane protein